MIQWHLQRWWEAHFLRLLVLTHRGICAKQMLSAAWNRGTSLKIQSISLKCLLDFHWFCANFRQCSAKFEVKDYSPNWVKDIQYSTGSPKFHQFRTSNGNNCWEFSGVFYENYYQYRFQLHLVLADSSSSQVASDLSWFLGILGRFESTSSPIYNRDHSSCCDQCKEGEPHLA